MPELLHSLWAVVPLAWSENALLLLGLGCLLALLGALFLLWLQTRPQRRQSDFPVRPLTLCFTLWVCATVLWGSYFWSLPLAGAFDLTVDRALFLLVLAGAVFRILRERQRPRHDFSQELLLFVVLVLGFISMSLHGFTATHFSQAKPWFIYLSGYLLPVAGFTITHLFLDPERDYPLLLGGLFLLGLYVALLAFLENYGLGRFVYPRYIDDRSILLHLDRSRGPFLNAAFNGQLLCICLLAGVAVLPLLRFPGILLHCVLLAVYVPAIWFTRTRSVYLQFAMLLLGLLLCYRSTWPKLKVLAIPMVAVLFLLLVNMERLASEDRSAGGLYQVKEIDIRFELMSKSRELIARAPFFGVGLAQFRSASQFTASEAEYQHNHLLGLASELGLVGLGVYLLFLGLLFRRYLRVVAAVPQERFINPNLVLLLGLGLLCSLISNTFVEPSLHIFANLNFFILAGMVQRLHERYVVQAA